MDSDLNIALVGDSVLDDHFWLDNPLDDIRAQTERTLKRAYPGRSIRVHNFAVDESTIPCVLHGSAPRAQYRNGRRLAGMEPYPVGEDGVVRQLDLLRKTKPTHVVLSVGGNDARARFLTSLNPDDITELMMTDGFVANLRRLVEIIRAEVTPNVIIVYVYMPQFKAFPLLHMLPPPRILRRLLVNFSKFFIEVFQAGSSILAKCSVGPGLLCWLVCGLHPKLDLVKAAHELERTHDSSNHELAVEFRLPIIDLSRTFDPYNKTHYGSTPIEPSNVSGQFIADLIVQVLARFNFGEETAAKIFSGVGQDLKVQDLGPDAREAFSYERELQEFLDRKKADKPRSSCLVT